MKYIKHYFIYSMYLIVLFIFTSVVTANDIFVPADYATIQEAIDASVDGDTIVVADGVWSGPGNRALLISGKSVTLRSESGNPETCIIDGELEAWGIDIIDETDQPSFIDGFTFKNCIKTYMNAIRDGAAIYIENASPIITNCRFIDCLSYSYPQHPGPDTPGPYGFGGAIAINGLSSAQITDCYFENCRAGEGGGAIWVHAENGRQDIDHVLIARCTFVDNSTAANGGAISVFRSTADIVQCVFMNNHALSAYGGAINFLESDGNIKNCVFESNQAFYGGAVASNNSQPIIGGQSIYSNLFDRNRAPMAANLYVTEASEAINARHNLFTAVPDSTYSVRPSNWIDLTGSSSTVEPITSDVYVSPTGDDAYDGLTPETAFRTTHYALSRIQPSASNPLTIHLAEGVYSRDTTGEMFPVPLISHVTLKGASRYTTILNGGGYGKNLVYGHGEVATALRHATLEEGNGELGGAVHATDCQLELTDLIIRNNISRGGGGLYLFDSQTLVERSRVSDNRVYYNGLYPGVYSAQGRLFMKDSVIARNGVEWGQHPDSGTGVFLRGDALLIRCLIEENGHQYSSHGSGVTSHLADLQMVDCIVRYNRGSKGAGLSVIGSFDLLNCLFLDNQSSADSPALYARNATGRIRHSTFAGNYGAASDSAAFDLENSAIDITDSIIWNQTNTELHLDSDSAVSMTYSAIRNGFSGTGNISNNPRFYSGPMSNYYLEDGSSGGVSSPCIDAGSDYADQLVYTGEWGVINMAERTATSNWTPDTGIVDMGYHWDHSVYTGVKLDLSRSIYSPGDIFHLNALVLSNSGATWFNSRIFVILEVYGHFWFAPSWIDMDNGIDFYSMDVPGQNFSHVINVIPPFAWPHVDHDADNLFLYGAITDTDITTILGNLDMVDFGYRQ